MAKDEAKRFLEEYKPGSELAKEIRAEEPEREEPVAAFYARVAAKHGFDFDAAELEEAYAERRDAMNESLEGVEIDDAELEELGLAGGWCWFSDQCTRAIEFTKVNPKCTYTYEIGEFCYFGDWCSVMTNSYDCTKNPD